MIAEHPLTFFERYPSVWVTSCMLAGVALGKLVPTMIPALFDERAKHLKKESRILLMGDTLLKSARVFTVLNALLS